MASLDPVDIVDLAEQLRKLGVAEFSVGDVRVVFTPGAVVEPRVAVMEDTDYEASVNSKINDTVLARAQAQGIGKPKFPGQE